MITYTNVLILLRYATKFSQYHLKYYYLFLKKIRPEGHTYAARKTFLMPTLALVDL